MTLTSLMLVTKANPNRHYCGGLLPGRPLSRSSRSSVRCAQVRRAPAIGLDESPCKFGWLQGTGKLFTIKNN